MSTEEAEQPLFHHKSDDPYFFYRVAFFGVFFCVLQFLNPYIDQLGFPYWAELMVICVIYAVLANPFIRSHKWRFSRKRTCEISHTNFIIQIDDVRLSIPFRNIDILEIGKNKNSKILSLSVLYSGGQKIHIAKHDSIDQLAQNLCDRLRDTVTVKEYRCYIDWDNPMLTGSIFAIALVALFFMH